MSTTPPEPYRSGEALVAALDDGVTWPGGADSVTAPVVAAAGAWDDVGAVVVLRRDEGGLVDDTQLAVRDSGGRWHLGACSGSGMPEWLLDRPDDGASRWMGSQLWVLTGQVGGVAIDGHAEKRWASDVTTACSRQVQALELWHRPAAPGRQERRLVVPVPGSGLVTVACELTHRDDEVRVRGLDGHGQLVSEEGYRPLLESDHGWPDPSLRA